MITKRLLDVCDFQGGTQPPKDEWINDPREGYVRMLQIRDYSQGDAKFIQYVKDTKKLHKCKKDDIMLSRYGYIGQAFMGLEGAYNVALVKVIKKEEIHTPYLLYYFQSYYFQHFLLSNVGARATIPGFNKDELENALIRMPEMSEQLEIASKISKVDELIGYHKKQLDIFETLIKSRFIEMFGEINAPSKWEKKPWAELVTIQNGRDYKHIAVESGGYAVYGTGGEMARASDYLCPENTIIVGRKGTINNPLLVKEKFWNVDTAFGVIVGEQLHYQYFYGFCRMFDFSTLNKQAVLPSTTKADLLKIQIAVPPIELQKQFATFVKQIDKSKF